MYHFSFVSFPSPQPGRFFTDTDYFRCIVSYLTLPIWLQWEALQRKKKTGHALPLQAMEDAEHSQVSAATMARIREINALEETEYIKDFASRNDKDSAARAEHIERAV